jgi:general secretion pathway protein D
MTSIATCTLTALFLIVGTGTFQAASAEETPSPESAGATAPGFAVVPLSKLIERLSGSPYKTMLVAQQVPSEVVTGDIGNGPVKYAVFLTILRNNFLAAVVSDNVVSIIPESYVRYSAPRTISSLEQEIPADEWVSFTHRPKHISAPQLVPILRPLMPQAAHLAAFPEQNALIIVDRFGNVKRLVGIIGQLDQPNASKE